MRRHLYTINEVGDLRTAHLEKQKDDLPSLWQSCIPQEGTYKVKTAPGHRNYPMTGSLLSRIGNFVSYTRKPFGQRCAASRAKQKFGEETHYETDYK